MFSTLESFDTKFSADSVEWCPIEYFRDIFVCGTYQLREKEEIDSSESIRRLGKIFLLRVENGRINLLQQYEGSAVLDMKWARARVYNKILLGVVNSRGFLEIYELMHSWSDITLDLIMKIQVEERDEVLALSLDWSIGNESNNNNDVTVIVSTSIGTVCLFQMSSGTLEKIRTFNCHEYEAWITAFDYWDLNIIYSGGDDCKFKSYDVRVDTPIINSSVHLAGVTSIQSNAGKNSLLATGSYDEQLRLWDMRKRGFPISTTNLGGGIWRVKWNPSDWKYLLAACMYGGFRLVDCEHNDYPNILAEYTEHTSISYGCDWSYLNSYEIVQKELYPELDKELALVSTCSFYDHLLNLSLIEYP